MIETSRPHQTCDIESLEVLFILEVPPEDLVLLNKTSATTLDDGDAIQAHISLLRRSSNISIEVPLSIQLPCIDVGGCLRLLRLSIYIKTKDGHETRVSTNVDEVESPQPRSSPGTVRLMIAYVRGVRVYTPRNVFVSPIYLIVSRIQRHRLRRRILVTIILNQWLLDVPDTFQMNVRAMRLPLHDRDTTRILHAMDE
ncbi:hypothetical protein NUW54_g3121 [Trametes sanguinea]|uniref:Uncharacterized protein n=1 Tax=Trametes sanguinea TaxID=158606 RepID=A0ACC1Q3W2_9APHY|nr:hypothetical protein NUW54_g3121 [Trametes sanguinea]